MDIIQKHRKIIGGVIFLIGSLLGFVFNILAVVADLNGASFWGDFNDALAFDHTQPAQAELIKIRCPILLAPGEEGTITATFRNPSEVRADTLVKAVVSEGDANHYRVLSSGLPIEAGDVEDFRWQITPQDIIERNFVLTRVFLMNQDQPAPYPTRTDSCGIFILSLFGLKGDLMVILMLVISLGSLLFGSLLIYSGNLSSRKSSLRIDYGLFGLTSVLTIGMMANLMGWWILAGLVLLFAVLLTTVLISNMLYRKF